ncbi:MAG TPA: helix-turn-helix transcriptional regulator [Candidatus Acidoferrum sp.]|nr:helix-turn-helix transcriptional regulator [Candidatus Acidoferrum sp.]
MKVIPKNETIEAALENGILVLRIPVRFDITPFEAIPVSAMGLSPMQEKVYSLIVGRNLTNKEIANELGITVRTVKFHVESILRKAHAETRAELIFRSHS